MIDREHDLPITRQAEVLSISRGSVYYLPRPVPEADLAIMRRLDRLHLEFPFAGSRMLRGLLAGRGVQDRPPSRQDADAADGDRGALSPSAHDQARARPQDLPVSAARAWRSRGRTRCGRWTSPTSRWRAASSIWPSCSTGSAAACCRGGCRSRWRRRSASRRWRMRWRATASRRSSTPTRAAQFTGAAFTGVLDQKRHRDQHGRQGRLARQRLRRAAVAQRQIRGGVSAGLRQRQRGPRFDRPLSRLLQPRIRTPICLCD